MQDSYMLYGQAVKNHVGHFQLFGTQLSTSVDDSFITLNVTDKIERLIYQKPSELGELLKNEGRADAHAASKGRKITVLDALNQSDGAFALSGVAGSGKTTALKYLAMEAIRSTPIRGKQRFPLFVQIRDINEKTGSIRDEMIGFLSSLRVPDPKAMLDELLESGSGLILIDGIDETSVAERSRLLKEIIALQRKYAKHGPDGTVLCISGRPYSLDRALEGFSRGEILPLDNKMKADFVRKWFSAVDPKRGDELIEILHSQKEILSIGSRPLLLAIICAAYHNDLELPDNSTDLFENCLIGLLGKWDLFRGVARDSILKGRTYHQRSALVARLARAMFADGRLVFSSYDVKKSVRLKVGATAIREEELPAADLLQTLYNDFGILIERAPGLFSFCHVAFQEYLTARSIVELRNEEAYAEIILKESQRWSEVIRTLGKILPDADRYVIATMKLLDPTLDSHLDWVDLFFAAKPLVSTKVREELFSLLLRTALDEAEKIGDATGCSYGIVIKPYATVNVTSVVMLPRVVRMISIAKANGYGYREMRFGRALAFSILRECKGNIVRVAVERTEGWIGPLAYHV